ncbi:MAG: YbaB/EbfC family nucleoid-associated protein [bacterium]|nr:YbaB/EbfC family nucleoid-associated protein [bacterium]
MMNMMNMMKQAQNIQKKLVEAQEELSKTDVSAESGNGSVKVICDGKGVFKSIKLSAEAINSENPSSVSQDDIEMLEDLIASAMNNATIKSKSIMESKMKSITGGVNIPGLM